MGGAGCDWMRRGGMWWDVIGWDGMGWDGTVWGRV